MSGWTPERKARQAELMRHWKPWERSTGPKTEAGKEVSKMNGWKHGRRSSETIELDRTLSSMTRQLRELSRRD